MSYSCKNVISARWLEIWMPVVFDVLLSLLYCVLIVGKKVLRKMKDRNEEQRKERKLQIELSKLGLREVMFTSYKALYIGN